MHEIILNKTQLVKLIKNQNVDNYSLEEIIDEGIGEFEENWFSLIIKNNITNKFYKTVFINITGETDFSKIEPNDVHFDSEYYSENDEIILTECKLEYKPTWVYVNSLDRPK